MPLISILFFFTFFALLLLFQKVLSDRKKFKQAEKFGITTFDLDLPTTASIHQKNSKGDFPAFAKCSDAEAFFWLVTPYIGSLNLTKREYIHQYVNDLKSELKINKTIYQFFIDEYKLYQGLNAEQAAAKWSGSERPD